MADKYDAAQILAASEKVYNNLMCLYGLEDAQMIVHQIDGRIADERRRRVNIKPKKRSKK